MKRVHKSKNSFPLAKNQFPVTFMYVHACIHTIVSFALFHTQTFLSVCISLFFHAQMYTFNVVFQFNSDTKESNTCCSVDSGKYTRQVACEHLCYLVRAPLQYICTRWFIVIWSDNFFHSSFLLLFFFFYMKLFFSHQRVQHSNDDSVGHFFRSSSKTSILYYIYTTLRRVVSWLSLSSQKMERITFFRSFFLVNGIWWI